MLSSILPKNKRKQFKLRYHSNKVEFLCSFFKKIKDTKKTFRNELTFTRSIFSHTVVRREQFGWMRQISVEKLDEDGKSRCTAREKKIHRKSLKFSKQKIIKSFKGTGKSLSKALLFAEHGENMLCKKLFLMSETISVHNMFSPGLSLEFSCIELVIQWTICHHIVG